MHFLSALFLLAGVISMVTVMVTREATADFRVLGLFATFACFLVSLANEYEDNVEAREAWMKKSEIRRAELYYCEEPKK